MPKKSWNILTTDKFIEKAIVKHGYTYDYSKVEYRNSKYKVEIICIKHGSFWQQPDNHLCGKGCAKCMHDKTAERMRGTTENFIKKSIKRHGNKYNYSKVKYKTLLDKVIIICIKHGDFIQTAADHIAGRGCQQCANERQRSGKQKFIENAITKHEDKYDYSKVKYETAHKKVIIICPIHGEFKQTANNHITGQGCPSCGQSGFDPIKPAILYYVRINKDNDVFYKIGVTNRTIEERFKCEKLEVIELQKWEYEFGRDAVEKETQIKKMFKNNLFDGLPIMRSVGNTEVFDFDVLNYDGIL